MTHSDAQIRTYRPTPPLRVWRTRSRNRPAGWVWVCNLCGYGESMDKWLTYTFPFRWALAVHEALAHLARYHGCPSMRASGEPCNEYCADCGGRMWIY